MALLFFAFTLVVFTVAGFFRGPESFRESLLIGVPMMVVDGLIGFQLFFLLHWAARFPAVARWSLVGMGVVAVALLQAAWDTQLRAWAGTLFEHYPTDRKSVV